MNARPPSSPLVDYVLRHMRVKTNVCTRQRWEHGYTLEPRTVTDYNLIYVTRGRVVWVIEGVDHVLTPGKLVLVPPHVPHRGYSKTRRVTLGSIHVEATLPGAVSGGQDVFALLRPSRDHTFTKGTPLDRYLRAALDEFDRPSPWDTILMLQSWSRLIVIELLRQAHERNLLAPRPIDPVVARILAELPGHIARPVSLNELAEHAGYTPQHLNRLFRRTLGVTALQYLTRLRMDRAMELLAEGRLTVEAVAQAVGYEDPFYFSRVFREHVGRSPAQYRDAAGSESPAGDSAGPWRQR